MAGKTRQTFPLPVKISGIGRYLPEQIVPSNDIEKRCGLPEGWCEQKQGIRERRWVKDETVAFMCAEAIREAVEDAGLELSELDLIFCAAIMFDRVIPDQAAQIQNELGLGGSGITCLSANSGCLSFMVGLDICACLLAQERYSKIVLVSGIVSSMALDFNNPNVCTILGDGAAAVVLTKTPENGKSFVHAAQMSTYSAGGDISWLSGEGKTNTMLTKELGFENLSFGYDPLNMQKTGFTYGRNFMKKLWPLVNATTFKIVIPTQSTRLIFEYVKLMFPQDRIVNIIDRFGNCGPAGYPLALYDAIKTGRIERGDLIMLYGMGAGWSIYGIVLTY